MKYLSPACGLLLAWMVWLSPSAQACINDRDTKQQEKVWDYDALVAERGRYPSVLEIITGKFLRHSKPFYQWRIKDRETKLQQNPDDPTLYDDLGTAYDKVGRHQDAVDLLLKAKEKFPNRYETRANLGTFYFHNGQFQKGIPEIKAALEINPQAHFGREEYQLYVVEYILKAHQQRQKEAHQKLAFDPYGISMEGFADFVMARRKVPNQIEVQEVEYQKAVKGILGMMHFGNYQSPILLGALADLLLRENETSAGHGPQDRNKHDAKRLAGRAYLQIAYLAPKSKVEARFRDKAREVLANQQSSVASGQLTLETVEKHFKQELVEGKQWYQDVVDDEKKWIAQGINPERAFDKKYYREPVVSSTSESSLPSRKRLMLVLYLVFAICLFVILYRGFIAPAPSS